MARRSAEHRHVHTSFEMNSTISSLGNYSVGMQRWKEQFIEYQKRISSRKKRRHRPRSDDETSVERCERSSSCMSCRTLYTIMVGGLFLSVLQGNSLKDTINEYFPQEMVNFDAIDHMHRLEVDLRPLVQSDSQPLSTFATLKHYEMSRASSLALDDEPQTAKSHIFMETNLVSIKTMAYNNDNTAFTPLFWHIPKAGGTTMHQFVANCLKLKVASNVGTLFGHADETLLQIIDTPSNLTYVNIDVTTPQGLTRARNMGFEGSGMADIVISPLLTYAVDRLFSPANKAVAFTVMRHPIERSISMFHYLQEASWEPTYRPEFKNWTLLDYTKRPDMDSDWMVRFLVDKPGNARQVPLTRQDLEKAKIIVRDKVWVGFIDNMQESVEKFGRKFGWSTLPQFNQCVENIGHGGANRTPHAMVPENSIEWQELRKVHALDMELYDYARALWRV